MFYNYQKLETIDISGLDTTDVTNMNSMFYYCSSLKTIDLSGLNTPNVIKTESMFYKCEKLTFIDLAGFDASSVEYSNGMFMSCLVLKTIVVDDSWNFNTGILAGAMFYNSPSLVGGNGTTYNDNNTSAQYARIDSRGTPGYLTHVSSVPHFVTVTVDGNGSAEAKDGSNIIEMGDTGTEVSLTKQADQDWHFKEWKVNSGGVTIGENEKFTIGNRSVRIRAVFTQCSDELEETKEISATCTEDGVAAYWTCKTCKKMYSDKKAETEITKPVIIPKTGHNMTKTEEVKATCTKDGTKAYWTCKTCKKLFSDKDGKTEITKPATITKTGHNMVKTDEVKATCTKDGTKAYWSCKNCKKLFSDKDGKTEITKPVVISKTGHIWGDWKTTKEPIETAAGEKQRVCKNDPSHVEKQSIPATGEKTIPQEKIVTGTLLAKLTAKGKKSLVLSWTKVNGAEGYDVFFSKCNSKKEKRLPKKADTITGNKTAKWTKTGLKKNTAYKAAVKAWVMKNGVKTYVMTSPTVHAYSSGGTKNYANPKSVTVKKKSFKLSVGKTAKIKASVNPVKKGKKLIGKGHAAKLRYLSSDKTVATVSSSGKIRARAKGSCKIYVYAANGVRKTVKVVVN